MQSPKPPTDRFEELQYQMVHAHDSFKLGYESILKHLENPPTDDLKNFSGYCLSWAIAIDGHHESEEVVLFPVLNQKMDFSAEVAAHKVIHEKLDTLIAYIKEFKEDVSKFDATRLKEMMAAFKDPLFSHLDQEVEHIAASNLKEAGFTEKELGLMLDDLVKYAKSHGDPFIMLPFMMSHNPPEWKPVWPGFPWILRKIVIPYVMARRYSGYWKYSPYSVA